MASILVRWWNGNDEDSSSSIDAAIHLGLSIDSDSNEGSEASSLCDFEEGMPLWVKHTPQRSTNGEQHPSTPIGFQIQLPRRGATLSLDAQHDVNTLTQRASLKTNLSLPLLNDFQERVYLLQQRRPPSRSEHGEPLVHKNNGMQRWAKLFLAVMAMGLVMASVNQQAYLGILNDSALSNSAPDFPAYNLPQYSQNSKQRQTLSSNQSGSNRVRSNVALARAQESLPVFQGFADAGIPNQTESTSDSLVSWLGGCAFVIILIETGWKGYKQSRLNVNGRRRR